MLGHMGVNVPDLPAAKRYYGELMPLLGFQLFLSNDDEFAYRPAGGKPGTYLFFYPSAEESEYSPYRTGLQHLAFMVRTRAVVDDVHRLASELSLSAGGRVLHEPQHFAQYPPPYYATFWLDPWGFKLEAVCHSDRP
jgi:catechol 2,3-dioxygenase-like lactoylglutathione lyase family enzyme